MVIERVRTEVRYKGRKYARIDFAGRVSWLTDLGGQEAVLQDPERSELETIYLRTRHTLTKLDISGKDSKQ